MLSLLTPAAPTRSGAAAGADAPLPGGRADEAEAGAFARALQQADAAAPAETTVEGPATPAATGTGRASEASEDAALLPADATTSAADAVHKHVLARAAAAAGDRQRLLWRARDIDAQDKPAPGMQDPSDLHAGKRRDPTDGPIDAVTPPTQFSPFIAQALPSDPAHAAPLLPPPAEASTPGGAAPADAASVGADTVAAVPLSTPAPAPAGASTTGSAPPRVAAMPASATNGGLQAAADPPAGAAPDQVAGADPDAPATAEPPAAAANAEPPAAGPTGFPIPGSLAAPALTPTPGTAGVRPAPSGPVDAGRRVTASASRSAGLPGARSEVTGARAPRDATGTAEAPAHAGASDAPAGQANPRGDTRLAAAAAAAAAGSDRGSRDDTRAGVATPAPAAPTTSTSASTDPAPRFADQLQAMLPVPGSTGLAPLDRPAASTAAAPAAQARVDVPLTSTDFPPALGAQVSLFARDGIERATIEIHPPEMGPISVQIALEGSSARVDFIAEAAATRQVIEAALPTLASSLRDAGMTLTGGGVFQQSSSGANADASGPGGQSPGHGRGGRGGPVDDGSGPPATVLRTTTQRGLVDLVA
jgi:flagellar hook-length control protein FliK